MLSLHKPSDRVIRTFLAAQRELPFSYDQVGASGGELPSGFVLDHHRSRLGEGKELFERAREAIERWKMFELGWVELCWPEAPLQVGSVVAVLARALGLWTLNACRIVYLVDEVGELARFGFAYGTLPGHIERGEERFWVQWNRADDSVWYDMLAFSRPNKLIARIGYPIARHYQSRFARGSIEAMRRAVGG